MKKNFLIPTIDNKIVLNDQGQVHVLVVDPMKSGCTIDHFQFDNTDKDEFDLKIELHCLILSSVCMQYFDSEHKAIWIDETIFLKGRSQTILRIKRISDNEYIDLDVQER